MKSLFHFIVEPVGERYDNKVKVGDKSLIINTQVETFKSVNNIAKVIEVPLSVKTVIKKGDIIAARLFIKYVNPISEPEKLIAFRCVPSVTNHAPQIKNCRNIIRLSCE